jgi:microcin C transport system permease protein
MNTTFQKFKTNKRGYYSLLILVLLFIASLFAPIWINNKAIALYFNDKWYFPVFQTHYMSGQDFELEYTHEVNYRELSEECQKKETQKKCRVWMPIVPYSPYEILSRNDNHTELTYPPYPPSWKYKNYLGTDFSGRDIFARLFYGLRKAFSFSLLLMIVSKFVGVSVGLFLGFWGGMIDLIGVRLKEIWSNVPVLYVIIIIASIFPLDFFNLIFLTSIFSWMSMSYYIRALTMKEKNRDYVAASKILGASNFRLLIKHILPNVMTIVVTFLPFSFAAGISLLVSLDYLGFGVTAPEASWGELIHQGTQNLDYPWIILSVTGVMIIIFLLITFVGEALREIYDSRKTIFYA